MGGARFLFRIRRVIVQQARNRNKRNGMNKHPLPSAGWLAGSTAMYLVCWVHMWSAISIITYTDPLLSALVGWVAVVSSAAGPADSQPLLLMQI